VMTTLRLLPPPTITTAAITTTTDTTTRSGTHRACLLAGAVEASKTLVG